MQYMLLIYDQESEQSKMSEGDMQAHMAAYGTYTQQLQDAGVMVAGDALTPTQTATTVRVRDGEVAHTDGPFAETKEQLGGYYLLECEDLDAALGWAAKCPSAKTGSIEVRPVMVFD